MHSADLAARLWPCPPHPSGACVRRHTAVIRGAVVLPLGADRLLDESTAMFAILLGLTSAVAYGVSDFVGGVASRRVQALRVVLISYPVSALVIGVLAPFVGGTATRSSLVWGAASGVVMALAMWWFYIALSEGPMSVVSPVTAVIVAGLPVVVGIALGERPAGLAYAGIAIAIVAILLVSKDSSSGQTRDRAFTPRVAWFTFGAGTCFALSFVFTHQISAGTGLWPLLVARGIASLVVVAVALVVRQAVPPSGSTLRLAVLVGLLDVIANVTMLYAFHDGLLSVVSVVIALYPAVTVAFAVVFLKERIVRLQIAGLFLSLVAIVAVAASS